MSSMSNVAELSKYIRTFPNTKISIFSMIFISFLTGVVIFLIDPFRHITLVEKIFYGGAFGFGIFGISSIMGAVISQQLITSMKGINLKTKHSMLLALISMIVVVVVTIIGSIISAIFHMDLLVNSVLFGCVLIFALLIFVLWSISTIGFLKSVIVSFIQPLMIISMSIVVIFLANADQLLELGLVSLLIKVIIASFVLILAVYSFIKVIESPMKKNLGIGLLDLLSLFISHVGFGSSSLETVFEDIGEPVDTLVGIVAFKSLNNKSNDELESTKSQNKLKSLFISPFVHPGPIGDIGGSNMPTVLANRFNNFTMVAHGPSTHDFNPVSQKEIDKIEATINEGLAKMTYSQKASKFIRYSQKNAKIGVQFFNDSMILLTTFAPHGSDDIEFSVGLSMMSQSQKQCNVKNTVVVDCHNSFNEEKGRILPGNPEVFQLLDAIDKIKCEDLEEGIKLGHASELMEDLDKTQGIGQSGLKTMVIEVQNQRIAYILLDSNNMENGFREEIIDSIKADDKLNIDDIEVMTSDTHFVNTLSNGYNPVGVTEREKIVSYVKSSISNAILDLEPVEVGVSVERIYGLNTFGPNNSVELVSTISSIVAVSKIMAPIIFILAILFVFVWIFYLPGI